MSERSLKDVALFEGCGEAARAALEERAQRRELAKDEVLFREGDPGTFMFALLAGRLEISKRAESGALVALRTMSPGDVGGLTTVTTDKTRSATLRALEPVTVAVIEKPDFNALLEAHPDLARSLIAFLAGKVRAKTHRVATLLSSEQGDPRPQVAVFDTKSYDQTSLTAACGDGFGFRFFEPRLTASTARLAAGHVAVCPFVNDELGAPVIEALAEAGVGLIALRCAGYNNVDVAAARAAGIDVVRVPAYSPHAVAEHAAALILALNRKTHRAYNRVREGNFSLTGLVGFDLHGRTAGIVGLGKIGRCLAEILRGFGMVVLAHDLHPDAAFAASTGVEYVGLEDLLERSDVVSLHAPLLKETYHLIDAAAIARMKPGVVLINTSRGGLVDARALIDGLKSGRIGAAGLDVYEEESGYFFEDWSDALITDDLLARLTTFNNVLITSHQGFLTDDALGNIADTTVGNIAEWLSGKRGAQLTNVVEA